MLGQLRHTAGNVVDLFGGSIPHAILQTTQRRQCAGAHSFQCPGALFGLAPVDPLRLVGFVDQSAQFVVNDPDQDLLQRVESVRIDQSFAVGLLAQVLVGCVNTYPSDHLLAVQLEAALSKGNLIQPEPVIAGIPIREDSVAKPIEHRSATPVRDLPAGLSDLLCEALDGAEGVPVVPVDVTGEISKGLQCRCPYRDQPESRVPSLGSAFNCLLSKRVHLGTLGLDTALRWRSR